MRPTFGRFPREFHLVVKALPSLFCKRQRTAGPILVSGSVTINGHTESKSININVISTAPLIPSGIHTMRLNNTCEEYKCCVTDDPNVSQYKWMNNNQWDLGSNCLDNVGINGYITLSVKGENECGSSPVRTQTLHKTPPVGCMARSTQSGFSSSEIDNSKINVFPSTIHEQPIEIEVPVNLLPMNLEVYDVTGGLLRTEIITQPVKSINLDFKEGLLLFRFFNLSFSKTYKIIKE